MFTYFCFLVKLYTEHITQMDKNKKIIVGTVFAITALLASLSIYVSWELRRDLAPDDSAADVRTTVTIVESTKIPATKVPATKVPPTKIPPTKVPPTTAPTRAQGGGGGVLTPAPTGPLPSTALVNDRVDTLIVGSLLVITGIILYRKYLNFGSK